MAEGLTPEQLVAMMPFAAEIGLVIDSATAESVEGHLQWAPQLCTSAGMLHGGVLMSLADSLGAVCAFLNLPDGATTSTIESKTNFFRAVREGRVQAITTPLHAGRTTIVLQTDVRTAEGKRAALVTQTQAVIPARQ